MIGRAGIARGKASGGRISAVRGLLQRKTERLLETELRRGAAVTQGRMDVRRGYVAASGLVGIAACAAVFRLAVWPLGFRLLGAGAVLLAMVLVADALRRFG